MRVLTRAVLAAQAYKHWSLQYKGWGGDKAKTARALFDLGESPDPDDVDRVTGNLSWTRLECDVCCQVVECAVEFPMSDGPSTIVCIECMRKSMEMVEWHLGNAGGGGK